jgi:hypothetical protein
MKVNGQNLAVAAAVAAAALLAGGCAGGSEQSSSSAPAASPVRFTQPALGKLKDLPIAPESKRVDLVAPTFSNPTGVTNPLFPIRDLRSALLLGRVDGKQFRVEVTLLPGTAAIDWQGRRIRTLESQYVAFLDGQIHEVALDLYAQDDGGSVWYFGEDVFNYESGAVADTDGTWHAGEEGPAAMIMPANPRVGDVYRPENIPGIVFEEVAVKEVGRTVDGPSGPVRGAIVVRELHQDGKFESKTFAPGYGEFYTGAGGDVEALALAVPTDALPSPAPHELRTLAAGAADVFAAAGSRDWDSAARTLESMSATWKEYRAGGVPELLAGQMRQAIGALSAAVRAGETVETRRAALDVAGAVLDLELRHRPVSAIDRARFDLWAARLRVDAEVRDTAAVKGDVTVLEWIWDRIAHTTNSSARNRIEARLRYLRAAAAAEELTAVGQAASRLPTLSSLSHRRPV